MVAVIDIGNTNIHMGLYEGKLLIGNFKFPSSMVSVENKVIETLIGEKLKGVAIASVKPRLTSKFNRRFKKKFGISPLIISSKINFPIKFEYYNPKTLGADRIACVIGGVSRYKRDLIIIDFGTATTFDVVYKNGDYLGGLILPGIGMSLEMLSKKTALLPNVEFKKPISTIGRSTEECIRSGVFNGTVMMVKGLIKKIKKENKKNFVCVSTGGWGRIMAPRIAEIKHNDPDLCLYGILKIYYHNV